MEQNREIILELRGQRTAPGNDDTGWPVSNTPPSQSHNQGHEDDRLSISASQFRESRHEGRARVLGSWEEKMEDVKKEIATIREALKGKTPVTIDELIQRTDHSSTSEVMT